MKAVVFDMDGVLFDTERLCMNSWVAEAEALGLAGMKEIYPLCIGRNANDDRQTLEEAYGAEFDFDGFCERARERMRRDIAENGLPVKPGINELLEWLKEEGFSVGLASSTGRDFVLSHLEKAGMSGCFSVVIGGDMVEHSKPQPDIYRLACERLGVNPKEAYAIEDSPNGIRAAHAAGMCPIMVPDMIMPDVEMQRLSRVIKKDLTEVLWYLQQERKKEQ